MYERHEGDDLLSKDERLRYKWRWSRGGSGIKEEEIKKWTHFQISYSEFSGWELEAIQWSRGYDNTNEKQTACYEAVINFNGNKIDSINEIKTRILAEIAAEKLLHDWVQEQSDIFLRKKGS